MKNISNTDILIKKDIHKTDNLIMQIAVEMAKKSDMRSKHGCIIIDNKGSIISKAFNKTLNVSSKQYDNFTQSTKVSCHAEENALRNVDPKKLNGAKLYVIRWGCIDTNPLFMNSKPCKKCTCIIEKYMKKFGLKTVYYSQG
jgi:deoxycytidylate deaminase